MLNYIISICFLVFMGVSSAVFFVIALAIWLVTVLIDRRLAALHMFTCFWGSLYMWIMPPWSVTISGREKIDKKKIYVIVSNHQSLLDILVAFRLFAHFKWVSKAEIFNLPFIGWNMVLNRYIKLKRGDRESIRTMMGDCKNAIAKGSSVYFFPEGTRSKTGLMRPFKPGAFVLAHELKTPILPIAINGTKNALPKHSLKFQGRHDIRIEILDEIPYADFADLSPEETGEMVRNVIAGFVDEHSGGAENKEPHE